MFEPNSKVEWMINWTEGKVTIRAVGHSEDGCPVLLHCETTPDKCTLTKLLRGPVRGVNKEFGFATETNPYYQPATASGNVSSGT